MIRFQYRPFLAPPVGLRRSPDDAFDVTFEICFRDVAVDTKDFSLGFLLDPIINSIIKLLKTQIAFVVSKALFTAMNDALAEIDFNATIKSIQ